MKGGQKKVGIIKVNGDIEGVGTEDSKFAGHVKDELKVWQTKVVHMINIGINRHQSRVHPKKFFSMLTFSHFR